TNIRPLPGESPSALWEELSLRTGERFGARLSSLDEATFQCEMAFLRRSGEQLAAVLIGDMPAVALLFPEGQADQAQTIYQQSFSSCNSLARQIVAAWARSMPDERQLRVLEIGAGVGSTTTHVLPVLPRERTAYVYTDISRQFLHIGREQFASYEFV